jgi:hypothetical protein
VPTVLKSTANIREIRGIKRINVKYQGQKPSKQKAFKAKAFQDMSSSWRRRREGAKR